MTEEQDIKWWNMNKAWLMRLDRRLDQSSEAAIDGILLRWYRVLRQIYSQIHFKVMEDGHEEAEKKLDMQFKKVKNMLYSKKRGGTLQSQINQLSDEDIEIELDNLAIQLSDLLYDYGFIFPKNKKEMEEELEDDFKGE